MAFEYKYFKLVLEEIDSGCPSLENYEDFLPPRSMKDICFHFKNEEEFIAKATNYLDKICHCKITDEMIAGAEAKVVNEAKRLIAESAVVDREDFITLLREDWSARHVGCAA